MINIILCSYLSSMNIFEIDDIYILLNEYLDLPDQLSLRSTARYHYDFIPTKIVQEYIKYKSIFSTIHIFYVIDFDYVELFKRCETQMQFINYTNQDLFNRACKHNKLNIIKYMHSKKEIYKDINILSGFEEALYSRYLDVLKYLYQMNKDKNDFFIYKYHHITNIMATESDKIMLDILKWLHLENLIDIHMNNDIIFASACNSGLINVIKWIYSLGNVNIHESSDIYEHRDAAFILLVMDKEKHLKICELLMSYDPDYNYNKLFKKFCIHPDFSKLYAAKWLYQTGKIDYGANYFEIQNPRAKKEIKISTWLKSLLIKN